MKLTIRIIQEFKIKDGTVTSIETVQQLFPATLVLETMSKEDVGVMQGRVIILRKFLQTNDIGISRSISLPAKLVNKRTANPETKYSGELTVRSTCAMPIHLLDIFFIIKDSLFGTLNSNLEASIQQDLGGSRSQCSSVFHRLGLSTKPEMRGSVRCSGHVCFKKSINV